MKDILYVSASAMQSSTSTPREVGSPFPHVQMRWWLRLEIKAGVGGSRLLLGGPFFTDQIVDLFHTISFLSLFSTLPLLLLLLSTTAPQKLLLRRITRLSPSPNSSSLLYFSHSSFLSFFLDHFFLFCSFLYKQVSGCVCQSLFGLLPSISGPNYLT